MTEEVKVQKLTIDLNKLEWEDFEEIEDIVGHPIGKEMADGNPSMRTVRALVLFELRKKTPELTLATMPSVRSLAVEMKGEAKVNKHPLASRRQRAR